ncbi:hypothetical protein [uncultured Nostoc sp.]|uniref:hypothetical protein n=1 Tax=uncultured Nostoc sp. TaxID=340711 RepID=UPI0035CC336F
MGNEESSLKRKKSNKREESPQGIELQTWRPGGIQSRPESSQRSSISLPESLHPPERQLELVEAELKKLEFKYGQGSDCRKLAMDTIDLAESKGIKATLKQLQKGMLVEKGTIKGDTRQSNTAGKEMWYFEEHFWCEINGIQYDPLFDKRGKPNMDLESERPNYKECYISKFNSGKAMVHESRHSEMPITADTVFQSYEEATKFVDKRNPNYNSDSEG